jgi:4-aminobutyrate aminotransferase-like enzyme
MARKKTSSLRPIVESDKVREAAKALVAAVCDELSQRELSPEDYEKAIRRISRQRGRPLMYQMISGGRGQGARVFLADGSRKLDFISGIGPYAFGHGNEDLLETAVAAAASDVAFQGHLLPGPEYLGLTQALLKHAGANLKHAWLSLSGAMANENALKVIFQKHTPADRIVVFENAFHGRTLATAELSDRPAFREGLPLRGNVLQVPFYDPNDEESIERSLSVLDGHFTRYPGKIAGMCFEIVQGEGGFKTAPREFFTALMEHCRNHGIAVWVDEVQTFARTGELFAFQTFDLESWVDVVTVGKILQGSAMLCTKAYNPKPGLIAGTYAGSTVGMAVGQRIIERMDEEGYLGLDGRVAVLGRRIEKRFESLEKRMPKAVGPRSGIGAMQAFVPFDGSPEVVKTILHAAFEEGLLLMSAGSNPTKIRMLPPVNTTDEELEACFTMLEKAMRRVAEECDLPC